jgi:hypothetical protein
MTSGSLRWIVKRTTMTAPETTTPGPRIADLTDDYEVRTPGVKLKEFECHWLLPKCNAVLHNLDTVWKHVKIVHGREKELRCFRGTCPETAVNGHG